MPENVTPTFYAPWPLLGVKLKFQWENLRANTEVLSTLIKAAGYDQVTNSRLNHSLQSWELGEEDFHNRFRTVFNKTDDSWSLQRNTGTEAAPIWEDVLVSDSAGNLTDKDGTAIPGGGGNITVKQTDDIASFYNITTVAFNTENFYITQNSPNLDTAIVNLRGSLGGGGGDLSGGVALGGDEPVFAGKVDSDLTFKGLSEGTGIALTSDANQIFIESTVPEFYLTVKQSDDSVAFKDLSLLAFNVESFYLTQNDPNTDEVLINLRGSIKAGESLATGEDILAGTSAGETLQFKGLTEGNKIKLSSTPTDVKVEVRGFYLNNLEDVKVQDGELGDVIILDKGGVWRSRPQQGIGVWTIQYPTKTENISGFFTDDRRFKVKKLMSVSQGPQGAATGFNIHFGSDRSSEDSTLFDLGVVGNDGFIAASHSGGSVADEDDFDTNIILPGSFVWLESFYLFRDPTELNVTIHGEFFYQL